MNFDDCDQYSVCVINKLENGIGGFIEVPTELFKVKGFLDLLSGEEKTTNNSFMEESTHIFLTEYIEGIKRKVHYIKDEQGNRYDITLVDDPMKFHRHLEIYLKFIGDK
ncbi:hypothetical protein CSC2_12590 [Clostridium zeae]|uniref:Head-tail adaptor protein n=1 Tax=Clostridium zeae TaxID=2759022 RepID=A0ABQ1E7L2_9CLOT|nr:head-tail adaptor protein [Clostridium zeae]GFZ30733.1 hypothetical protein CSC2_12590 [Clostridium zeae]